MHAIIDKSDDFRDVLTALEFFLSKLLREAYPNFKDESLDGIYPEAARKTGDDEIEIIGLCVLISDQTLTPLQVRLQLDATDDACSWIECRLGESIAGEMRKAPYSRSLVSGKLQVVERLDSVEWVYRVGYGKRRT